MDEEGTIPLVAHGEHVGLPGGRVSVKERKQSELFDMLNIRHIAPTIVREVQEELHMDISPQVSRVQHLGIAAVEILHPQRHRLRITDMLAPILFLRLSRIHFPERVARASLSHLPANLYPDAAFALQRVRELEREKRLERIEPVYLNRNVYAAFLFDPPGNIAKYFYT